MAVAQAACKSVALNVKLQSGPTVYLLGVLVNARVPLGARPLLRLPAGVHAWLQHRKQRGPVRGRVGSEGGCLRPWAALGACVL